MITRSYYVLRRRPHKSFWSRTPGIMLYVGHSSYDDGWGSKRKFVPYPGDDGTFKKHIAFYSSILKEWMDKKNRELDNWYSQREKEIEFEKHLCDIAGKETK